MYHKFIEMGRVMCLIFSYLGRYAAMRVRNKDSWHRSSMTCENALEAWFHFEQDAINAVIDQWHNSLRSCVRAGGGHFEYML